MQRGLNKMHFLKLFILPYFILGIVGCSVLSGVGDDNTPAPSPLVHFTPEKKLDVRWIVNVGVGADKIHPRFDTVVQDGTVYTVDSAGKIVAVNAMNGQRVWLVKSKTCPSSGPALGSGYLVFGTRNGEVIALNSKNGHFLWRTPVSSQSLAPPRIANGLVLVKTVDGQLSALDLTTGKTRWNFVHRTPLIILQNDSMPLITHGMVLVGFGDGQLFALALSTGKLVWQQTVAAPRGLGDIDDMVDITADPVEVSDMVYVAAYQGRLVALSRQTGQIIWQRELSTHMNFAVQGHLILVVDEQGVIWAINRRNGQVIWQQASLKHRGLTPPLLLGEQVWLGDAQGNVHVLARVDGHFVARRELGGYGLFVQPVSSGKGVLVRTVAGNLVNLSLG